MNKRWKVDRKHKIINAYELPEVKKLIKPSIDEQVQYTDIALNSRVLIVGGSGTGKTNLIINYLIESSRPKKGTFYEVILVYKTDEVLFFINSN
jgi:ABC-type transporter Mla maintaining outer membrane lipid asymmetry ATPase subunit MlaF